MGKESYKQGLKDFNDFLLWVKYEDTKMTMMDGPSENFKKIFELFSEKLNKKVDNLYKRNYNKKMNIYVELNKIT